MRSNLHWQKEITTTAVIGIIRLKIQKSMIRLLPKLLILNKEQIDPENENTEPWMVNVNGFIATETNIPN